MKILYLFLGGVIVMVAFAAMVVMGVVFVTTVFLMEGPTKDIKPVNGT